MYLQVTHPLCMYLYTYMYLCIRPIHVPTSDSFPIHVPIYVHVPIYTYTRPTSDSFPIHVPIYIHVLMYMPFICTYKELISDLYIRPRME